MKPVDTILEKDQQEPGLPEGRGFAIVALDCLLLESLYGYERGKRTEARETGAAFADLLYKKSQFAGAFAQGRAAKFGAAVRNGLLHDGETRQGWLIWRGDYPLVEDLGDGRLALYRDAFHKAVKACFKEYFDKLRSPSDPVGVELRKTFKARVSQLCKDSRP
jgi:hypothetical protein